MNRQVQVEVLAGPSVGESFSYADPVILVGRGSQCTLQILSAHVSREQCEMRWYGEQLVLENKGKTNRTYVNDQPVDSVTIQDGDLVTFCDVALRVRFPHLAAAAAQDPNRTVAYAAGSPPGMPAQAPPSPPGRLGAEDTHPNPAPVAARAASPSPHAPPASAQPPPSRGGGPPRGGTGGQRAVGGGRPMGTGRGYGTGSHRAVAPGSAARPVPGGSGAKRALGAGSGTRPGVGAGGTGQQSQVRPPTKGGRGRRRGRKQPLNIVLVRNVLVVLAAVMGLLTITSLVEKKSSRKPATPTIPKASGEQGGSENLPKIGVNGRGPEEIVATADGAYRTAMTFLNEAEVADGNLIKAIDGFRSAKAQLLLVEPQLWPSFARTLNPRIQEAEEKLHQKFSQSKISYVRFFQAGDYDVAMKETERMIRLIPSRGDDRHKYARKQQKRLRVLMNSKKKKSFGG